MIIFKDKNVFPVSHYASPHFQRIEIGVVATNEWKLNRNRRSKYKEYSHEFDTRVFYLSGHDLFIRQIHLSS